MTNPTVDILTSKPVLNTVLVSSLMSPSFIKLSQMKRATSSSMETLCLTILKTTVWQEQCLNTDDQAMCSLMGWSI